MKPPVPLFFTCTACGHIHSETLQDMVSGKLPEPLACPACHRELSIDWDWITDQAEQLGLIFTERKGARRA
ncbi:hypothetical protein CF68_03495 [Cupriavidus sp. SK-4]|nr:hypothetical protein CF68_03495 [Cupriavidus sp. SK-4]